MAAITMSQNPFTYVEAETTPVNNTLVFGYSPKPAHRRLKIQIIAVTGTVALALDGTAVGEEAIPNGGVINFEIEPGTVINFITDAVASVFIMGIGYVD